MPPRSVLDVCKLLGPGAQDAGFRVWASGLKLWGLEFGTQGLWILVFLDPKPSIGVMQSCILKKVPLQGGTVGSSPGGRRSILKSPCHWWKVQGSRTKPDGRVGRKPFSQQASHPFQTTCICIARPESFCVQCLNTWALGTPCAPRLYRRLHEFGDPTTDLKIF